MGTKRRRISRITRGSITGSALGLFIFLVGVALLLFTFKQAFDMFSMPPQNALGIKPKEPLDIGQAGQSFVGLLIKVLLLALMGLMGSLIANRGVAMFAGSRIAPPKTAKSESD